MSALVFLVLGEVTPSWSSLTRGSADGDFRLTTEQTSLWPELDLDRGLEDSWSDDIFSLGLVADDEDDDSEDDEGLGVTEETGLLADSLEMGLGMRLDLELL